MLISAIKNRTGGAAVAILLIGFILNLVIAVVYYSVNSGTKKSGARRVSSSSLNIAEAGKEHFYALIRSGAYEIQINRRVDVFSNEPFGNGSYSVTCSSDINGDTLYILSTGEEGGFTEQIEVVAVMEPIFALPPPFGVRGAVTARGDVEVTGNFKVDGRDHNDHDPPQVVGPGTFGVSTVGQATIQGAAAGIGGNDIEPRDWNEINNDRSVILEEGVDISEIPATPEEILGLPPGALDQFIVTTLPRNFHGIYYLQNSVGPVHFGESSGILIVHNSSLTAGLQINTGNFKGLIIVDRMSRIAEGATILGAVVSLTEDESSHFGLGNARLRYSSSVLRNLSDYCDNIPLTVREASWKEVTQAITY